MYSISVAHLHVTLVRFHLLHVRIHPFGPCRHVSQFWRCGVLLLWYGRQRHLLRWWCLLHWLSGEHGHELSHFGSQSRLLCLLFPLHER